MSNRDSAQPRAAGRRVESGMETIYKKQLLAIGLISVANNRFLPAFTYLFLTRNLQITREGVMDEC